jgi:hypothetical protein
MKKLTIVLLTLLLLGSCTLEPSYEGIWVIDTKETISNCVETHAENDVNDLSEEDELFGSEWAESFGRNVIKLLCEGATKIFPVLEIQDNKFTQTMLGVTVVCNIKQESSTLDCINEEESSLYLDLSVTGNQLKLEDDVLIWSYLDNPTKLIAIDLIYKRR